MLGCGRPDKRGSRASCRLCRQLNAANIQLQFGVWLEFHHAAPARSPHSIGFYLFIRTIPCLLKAAPRAAFLNHYAEFAKWLEVPPPRDMTGASVIKPTTAFTASGAVRAVKPLSMMDLTSLRLPPASVFCSLFGTFDLRIKGIHSVSSRTEKSQKRVAIPVLSTPLQSVLQQRKLYRLHRGHQILGSRRVVHTPRSLPLST